MDTRFVFVGNRRFVLEAMLHEKIHPNLVIVVANSHLHRDLINHVLDVRYVVVHSKKELLAILETSSYDVLISNGCPYILPIAELPDASYINIHPSCLPDLRGIDPVIGSILHARNAGATCHIMDSGVDTGPIISQISIPYSEDLDVTTLYQLSFIAEQKVFKEALERHFEPQFSQKESADDLYYSRSSGDRFITFQEPNDLLLRKIKAFNNQSQGCEFLFKEHRFKVHIATRMNNLFLWELAKNAEEGTILLSYEDSIIFRKNNELLRFMSISPKHENILTAGDILYTK